MTELVHSRTCMWLETRFIIRSFTVLTHHSKMMPHQTQIIYFPPTQIPPCQLLAGPWCEMMSLQADHVSAEQANQAQTLKFLF